MPSLRDSDSDRRPRRRKKSRFPTGLVVVLALLVVGIPVLGGAGYYAYRAFQNRAPALSAKDRLLGEWTFFENDYLVNMNYTDGQLLITAAKNGEVRTERMSWTVLSDKGDSLTLRLVSTRPEEKPVVWLIEFLSDSQVRWTSKTSTKYAPRIYTRKGPAPSAPKSALPGLAGRLVGKWETRISDGTVSGRVVYEYGSDGSAGMTIHRPTGEPLGGSARWEVKSEKDKTIVIHVKGQGIDEERTITFTDNDTYRWTSPGKPYVEFRRVR